MPNITNIKDEILKYTHVSTLQTLTTLPPLRPETSLRENLSLPAHIVASHGTQNKIHNHTVTSNLSATVFLCIVMFLQHAGGKDYASFPFYSYLHIF